eukprot:315847-Prymnesium_polylepis.1
MFSSNSEGSDIMQARTSLIGACRRSLHGSISHLRLNFKAHQDSRAKLYRTSARSALKTKPPNFPTRIPCEQPAMMDTLA